MVLVSIIIPTYNRKDLLIKAVESILLQTYSNWELLIINDYENPIVETHIAGSQINYMYEILYVVGTIFVFRYSSL